VFHEIDKACRPEEEDGDNPEYFGVRGLEGSDEDISEYEEDQAGIDEQADKTGRQKERQTLVLRPEKEKGDQADFKEDRQH